MDEIEKTIEFARLQEQRLAETHERITYLELAIADIYEQILSIQQKEEPTND